MVRKVKAHNNDEGRICCICGLNIKKNSMYYKVGREPLRTTWKTKASHLRVSKLRFYCENCIDSIYVDGSKRKSLDSLIKINEVI
jgi:hypothetical protein